MGEFRYIGKSVVGEVEDEYGNIVPDIKDSADAFGFTFYSKRYTEVPDDAIAYTSEIPYKIYLRGCRARNEKPAIPMPPSGAGTLVYVEAKVVDKLRGNKEFQERVAEVAA